MALPATSVFGGPNYVPMANSATLLVPVTYFAPVPAAATNLCFFVAPVTLQLVALTATFATAAGGASTLTVTHETGTTAPGGGTSVMSGSFNLNATANTPQNATLATALTTIQFAAGDRMSVNYANTIQSTAGLVITAIFFPI